MRPNQSQRCDPAFSAVTPISEEVTPKASELCIIGVLLQISCLICLPDKSGNFLAFGAKTRKNTVKSEKTGFGMAITARLRPVFCVFRPKIPRTFYFKLTEQSRREKLAVGEFEPKNDMMQ